MILHHDYTYESAFAASQRINWRVEDLIGDDKKLDFSKAFLPESLARVEPLTFLTPPQRLALNQIRGHGYLYTFGLAEEFIEPFVLQHATRKAGDDDFRVRAYLQFASEEAKHIQLFKRFREQFQNGFGTICRAIGPPHEIAQAVLAHHPLAVALVTLHIEWMTQCHYVDSVKEYRDLDPQFMSLLRHHWLEEAQHAKLDTLMVEAMVRDCLEETIVKGIEDYAKIGDLIDGGLQQQVEYDIEALADATGRVLTRAEAEVFRKVQLQALRWTFLGSGMTHENFLNTIEALRPGARSQVEQMAAVFS